MMPHKTEAKELHIIEMSAQGITFFSKLEELKFTYGPGIRDASTIARMNIILVSQWTFHNIPVCEAEMHERSQSISVKSTKSTCLSLHPLI